MTNVKYRLPIIIHAISLQERVTCTHKTKVGLGRDFLIFILPLKDTSWMDIVVGRSPETLQTNRQSVRTSQWTTI